MNKYKFDLVRYGHENAEENRELLLNRPFDAIANSFEADARRFVPGEQLEIAINVAVATGEPLLITGEPGTGKTQAAYYAAYKLGIEPVIHFQVKSDSSSHDLLYHFDTVRYFHDAHFSRDGKPLDKGDYVEPRALWQAITAQTPKVLLIDEIDKAPRDFPNDLLLELDKMKFVVAETEQEVTTSKKNRPVVFITSNSERRLPEPFLRRCVYHHIRFNDDVLFKAVENRRDEYAALSSEFLKMAIQRFLALRDRNLRKSPSTGELLVWLRVLALSVGADPGLLENKPLSHLPYLGVLIKDHQDLEELAAENQK